MSDGEEKDQDTTEDKAKNDKKDTVPKPRALHKTSSIFLRNLAPSITKQEVEAVSESLQSASTKCFYQLRVAVFLWYFAVVLIYWIDCLQMCKRYPGFVRVALQDPQPERRFFRRAWVTFERDVNIKEICWNLNNIRVINIVFKHPEHRKH